MANAEFRYRGADGKALGTQGWNVDHDKASCCTYTGLWRGRKVVALLVAKGDFDLIGAELTANGDFIARACSSHDDLLGALRMLVKALPVNRDWLDPDIERFAKAVIAKVSPP